MVTIRPEEREAFYAALEEMGKKYDPKECMPATEFTSRGYHTALTGGVVHAIRGAFTYAVALLDGGRDADLARAQDILKKVLSLQDTDPANKTYGIWSYFLEEPLEKMAPPDWNWADFCGKDIIYILRDHKARLAPALREDLVKALRHACLSIFRRNMNPGYTNISIMGTYVTLAASEMCGWQEMFEYGKSRLAHLYHYNMTANGFAEYNSPGYSALAMTDLTRLSDDIQDEECGRMARELTRLAWRVIALHYHAETGAWAGPNARNYNWIEDAKAWTMLSRATGLDLLKGHAPVYNIEWVRVNQRCPEEYLKYFSGESGAHDASEALREVRGGYPGEISTERLVAFSYVGKSYTFSSFARCDTWNQRRTLYGHFGAQDRPGYVGVRMLHDFYDFSSGMIAAAQHKGTALFVQNFVTNGGDTHCNLDMIKNQTITASDMRLRILLGGPAARELAEWEWKDGALDIPLPGARLRFEARIALWNGKPVTYEVTRDQDQICFDIVFMHSDTPVQIRLDQLGASLAAGAICLDPDAQLPAYEALIRDETVTISGRAEIPLYVKTSALPVMQSEWTADVRLDDMDAAEYLDRA